MPAILTINAHIHMLALVKSGPLLLNVIVELDMYFKIITLEINVYLNFLSI